MSQAFGLLFLVISSAGALKASDLSRQQTTPVQKVAALLLKIRAKVEEEGKKEAAGYDKFACFCKEEADNKVYYIDKSNTLISELQADMDKLGGDVIQLDSEVVTLKADLLKDQGDADASATAAATEFETYSKNRANLTDGIDVITAAIEHLRNTRENVKNAKAAALLTKTRKALEGMGFAQPEGDAPVYKYQSADVIEVLMGLLQTFKAQRATCDQEYELLKHDRDMATGVRFQKMKACEDDITNKQRMSAFKTEEQVKKQVERDDETTAMNRDQAFLDELTTSCTAKATAWDERSKIRASEITALTQANNILTGIEGKYDVNKKLVGLQRLKGSVSRHEQTGAAPAFIQLRGGSGQFAAVIKFLSGRADALHSSKIAALAQSLRATAALAQMSNRVNPTDPVDHFVEVRSIVKDLIAKLEAQAASEATAKSLCDTQMKTAVDKRDSRTAAKETAGAGIDATESAIHGLENDITTMSGDLADMHKSLAEMTQLRADEKAANGQSIADATEGILGVQQATQILKAFYAQYAAGLLQSRRGGAADSTTFFPKGGNRDGQTVGDLAPESFDASDGYGGKQTESKGIFGMLEVIESDFTRTKDKVDADEKAAVTAFATDSKLLQQQIGLKEGDKTTAEGDKDTKEGDLITLKDDKKTATELHAAALKELEQLSSGCVDGEESNDERRAARKKEIEALKQAHQMLEDWKN